MKRQLFFRKMEGKIFYKYKISNVLSVSEIVTIHYQKLSKNYIFPNEEHDFWEMIYCDKNQLLVSVGNNKKLLKKGEILFIKPNDAHSVLGDGNADSNIFIVSFVCKSRTMTYFKDKQFKVPEDARYLLSSIMTEAKQTFVIPDFNPNLSRLEPKENANIGGAQLIKNNLEELLIKLIRAETTKPTSSEIFISKIENSSSLEDEIIKILQSNIYGKITLDKIASELHYGKTTVCKTFKQKTGFSIINYYLKLKIDESKKLIRNNHNFSEISELLGFDSLPHFTKTFKKLTQMTPREYKNSILN
ncbi:MAG: AraC family transcriptional regulator [Clostridia bacterium]|nr:AraC family transcriptional regulator [Clostridia bacterium]